MENYLQKIVYHFSMIMHEDGYTKKLQVKNIKTCSAIKYVTLPAQFQFRKRNLLVEGQIEIGISNQGFAIKYITITSTTRYNLWIFCKSTHVTIDFQSFSVKTLNKTVPYNDCIK